MSCRHKHELSEVFIGEKLAANCMRHVSDPTSRLGQQAYAWTHHVADLCLDLCRQQLDSQSKMAVRRVPDHVDEALLDRLEQEGGLYLGAALR
jgi:hypothetical protein